MGSLKVTAYHCSKSVSFRRTEEQINALNVRGNRKNHDPHLAVGEAIAAVPKSSDLTLGHTASRRSSALMGTTSPKPPK